jgi:hypothetical protein
MSVRLRLIGACAAGFGVVMAAMPALAVDLVKGRKDLPPLILGDDKGNDFAVSTKTIEMESGKSYRLLITSKGGKEYEFFAPEFLRSVWLNQIIINRIEVHMAGPPNHLEFDDAGTMAVDFVTIRPGTFTWRVKGFEDKGMTGQFIVK